jgi:hypothetical protein
MKARTIVVFTVLLLGGLAWRASAQTHMPRGVGIMQQGLALHPDTSIVASASPTALPTPADGSKVVDWICANVGGTNSARIGPCGSVSASSGVFLPASGVSIAIPFNGALCGYSDAGTIISCNEVTIP